MAIKTSILDKVVFASLLIGASAQATILNEYSALSSWNAATTSQTTQNFNSAGTVSNTTSSGINLNSVNYLGFYNESSSVSYDTFLWNNPSAGYSTGTGGYIMGGPNFGINGTGVSTPDSGLQVNFASLPAFNALSFDFSAIRFASGSGSTIYSTVGTPINLLLEVYEAGGAVSTRTLTVPVGSPSLGFYGFTTTGTINSIRILISTPTSTEGNRVILDNLAYAQIAGGGGTEPGPTGNVPEPQTYFICGVGLLALSVFRRKSN